MRNRFARQVHQVDVTDPVALAARPHDYADAFELVLPGPDPYLPEEWVRAGLESTPRVVDWIVGRLGFDESQQASPDQVSGFRIVESGPEVVHLEVDLPLLRVVMVGRKVEPTRRMLSTVVHYRRPVLARLVMAAIRPGHRRAARGVVTSKISTPTGSGKTGAKRAG